MRSISPRWASLKACAPAGAAAMTARQRAAAVERSRWRIAGSLLSIAAHRAGWGFIGHNVVGANPPGRTGGKARFGAGGKVAGGAVVAAREGRLGGGEIGLGEVAFAAVGH